MKYFGGIDAGGTTFKCVITNHKGDILQQQRFSSENPPHTLQNCLAFFRRYRDDLAALGVASFGPLDVDRTSPTYGSILNTPKAGWSHTNLRQYFQENLNVPVIVDTDVNGALLGEMAWGAAQDTHSSAYVTIGTGVGAGIYSGGRFLGAPSHPEFGHIRVERHPDDDFAGVCSFHGNCLEGLASAPSLAQRFGPTLKMAASHPGWGIEAWYLAQACISLYLTARPERIILGGGIMLADGLIDLVRKQTTELMNGYTAITRKDIDALIVTPGLGDNAGVLGAVQLAITN